jgi:hypothetical protein
VVASRRVDRGAVLRRPGGARNREDVPERRVVQAGEARDRVEGAHVDVALRVAQVVADVREQDATEHDGVAAVGDGVVVERLALERDRGGRDAGGGHPLRRGGVEVREVELVDVLGRFDAGVVHGLHQVGAGDVRDEAAGRDGVAAGVLEDAVARPDAEHQDRGGGGGDREPGERREVAAAGVVDGGDPADGARDDGAVQEFVAFLGVQGVELDAHARSLPIPGVTGVPGPGVARGVPPLGAPPRSSARRPTPEPIQALAPVGANALRSYGCVAAGIGRPARNASRGGTRPQRAVRERR